jgi:predicted amidophosphoribosyltransferase
MTKCVSCGGALGADARFCPSCGATAPASPPAGGASGGAPAGPPACPVCAAVLPPDARFCGECGTPLAASGSQIPGPAYASPTYQVRRPSRTLRARGSQTPTSSADLPRSIG